MSDEINISPEPPKPITVNLVGKKYKVRPIKSSLGIAMAQRFQNIGNDVAKLQAGMDSVISTIFGKADRVKIQERLLDPDDQLDLTHITELMNALVEKSSGNPTT